jgi:hypothetical protein
MKKITLFLMLLLLVYLASAQSLATIVFSDPNNNLPEIGDNFNVPVNIAGFTEPVRYIEVVMEYNTEALLYTGVTNQQDPSCLINVQQPVPGMLVINYNQVVLAFNVSDGKLFDIQFDYLEGSSDLIFGAGSSYRVGSIIYSITDFTHGSVEGLYVNNFIEGGTWENPDNWSKGVLPDDSHNVFIQGFSSIASEAACNNLTIEINQQLIVEPAGSLTVSGVIVNHAGINGLVLESTTDGTASLIHSTPEVRATMQQFIYGPEMAMHQITSPMDNMEISTGFNDGSILTWYEPAQTWVSYQNTTVWPTWNDANNSDYFMAAKGYMTAFPYVGGNPQTKNFTGELNEGPFSFSLSNQAHPDDPYQGFNLAGNPYPSSIDWKAAEGWDRNSLLQTPGDDDGYSYWIWNPIEGQYGTFHSGQISETGTAGTSRYIAPMQGFWVSASQDGLLGMDNRIRVHSDQNWLKNEKTVPGILRLSVSSETNPYKDETILEFGHETNRGGSKKMFSIYQQAPGLYAIKNNDAFSISFWGSQQDHPAIPLGFKPGVNGQYTLTVNGLEAFGDAELEDLQTGIIHPLSNNNTYQFQTNTGDEPRRFMLHFKTLGVDQKAMPQPYAYYHTGELLVFNPWQDRTVLHVIDASGRSLHEYHLQHGRQNIPFSKAPGFYMLILQSNTKTASVKLMVL